MQISRVDVVVSGTEFTLSSTTELLVPHKTNTKIKAVNLKLFFIINNYIKEPFLFLLDIF